MNEYVPPCPNLSLHRCVRDRKERKQAPSCTLCLHLCHTHLWMFRELNGSRTSFPSLNLSVSTRFREHISEKKRGKNETVVVPLSLPQDTGPIQQGCFSHSGTEQRADTPPFDSQFSLARCPIQGECFRDERKSRCAPLQSSHAR